MSPGAGLHFPARWTLRLEPCSACGLATWGFLGRNTRLVAESRAADTTCVPPPRPGELYYKAQSPDEGALVTAARNFGFVFRSRTPKTTSPSGQGADHAGSLLCGHAPVVLGARWASISLGGEHDLTPGSPPCSVCP